MMSSGYLTSQDLQLIDTLLAEHRTGSGNRTTETELRTGRLLIDLMSNGVQEEDQLRQKLRHHLESLRSTEIALSEWENEGGASYLPRHYDSRHRIAPLGCMRSSAASAVRETCVPEHDGDHTGRKSGFSLP
ncbi:hypothetical protein EL18_02681 [Nitratireductor basaltis]|uniref:Uncharacterized protein n=1 Tax=Nitratireductor basaltis TaxID=472175 RepID=A0A084U644_9HYPH|nr:hypothetical protein EL18_02681 [Nitratireductor basaltis]